MGMASGQVYERAVCAMSGDSAYGLAASSSLAPELASAQQRTSSMHACPVMEELLVSFAGQMHDSDPTFSKQ